MRRLNIKAYWVFSDTTWIIKTIKVLRFVVAVKLMALNFHKFQKALEWWEYIRYPNPDIHISMWYIWSHLNKKGANKDQTEKWLFFRWKCMPVQCSFRGWIFSIKHVSHFTFVLKWSVSLPTVSPFYRITSAPNGMFSWFVPRQKSLLCWLYLLIGLVFSAVICAWKIATLGHCDGFSFSQICK